MWLAFAIALCAVVVTILRRPAMPITATLTIILGALLLGAAAGDVGARLPEWRKLVVMVDRSESTRTAEYRSNPALKKRLEQLIGDAPFREVAWSSGDVEEKTYFIPPAADAIVLFSDARFDLPATAPPTYIVVDPNLEHPPDAAVERLEARGDTLVATVHNNGPASRELTLGQERLTVPTGEHVLRGRIEPAATMASAKFAGEDPWPENDQLAIVPPPPPQLQRWWVGGAPPDSTWRAFRPEELPTDPAAYLVTAAIVLNNVPADAIPPAQQDRLMQHVRDLSGGLVIVGGDHAFAAGGYIGTQLEALSPLSSAPPQPRRHWILLADSSGSMAAPADDGQTRWLRAAESVKQILDHLPPADVVSIGSFARNVSWWSQSRLVGATQKLKFPAQEISPGGPTNLQPVLEAIAAQLDANSATETEIIVVSDADARIDDPAKLAGALTAKRAKLHLLATADASRSGVPDVVKRTGGQIVAQPDPRLWADASQKLLRAASADQLMRSEVEVSAISDLGIPPRRVSLWNRTWLKRDAIELATAQHGDEKVTIAARWHVGEGQVAAVAYPAEASEVEALATSVARPPRDPKYKLRWDAGPKLTITLDATDGATNLNDLDVTLSPGDAATVPLPQIAPGKYEISLPAPRSPLLAAVRVGKQVVDRFAVAGRYAPEFDGIGNDHDAMNRLAQLSGGAVIPPSQTTPIAFNWPRRMVSLTPLLSTAGAALIAMGLVLWKNLSPAAPTRPREIG
jgi:hypothetical protein